MNAALKQQDTKTRINFTTVEDGSTKFSTEVILKNYFDSIKEGKAPAVFTADDVMKHMTSLAWDSTNAEKLEEVLTEYEKMDGDLRTIRHEAPNITSKVMWVFAGTDVSKLKPIPVEFTQFTYGIFVDPYDVNPFYSYELNHDLGDLVNSDNGEEGKIKPFELIYLVYLALRTFELEADFSVIEFCKVLINWKLIPESTLSDCAAIRNQLDNYIDDGDITEKKYGLRITESPISGRYSLTWIGEMKPKVGLMKKLQNEADPEINFHFEN